MALSPDASDECSMTEEALPLQLEMYVDSDNDDPMFLNGSTGDLGCTLTNCANPDGARLRQHNREQWVCPACGINFPTVFYLREHMKTHEILSENRQEVLAEEQNVKKAEFVCRCRLCEKQFTSLNDLEEHMHLHPNNNPLQCSVCKKEFVLPESLDVHMWSHLKYSVSNYSSESSSLIKPVSSKLHTCNTCKKTFRNGSYFQLHLRTHTGDKTYSCQICGKTFSCSWNLKTHLAVHRDDKPFICSICGVGFKLKANMQRHERSHQPHERAALLCRIKGNIDALSQPSKEGGQEVNASGILTNSLMNHLDDRNRKNDSQNLTNHDMDIRNLLEYESSHSQNDSETSYNCSVCDKNFSSAHHLKLHVIEHNSDKPYSCSRCGMGFKVKANLVRHERLHAPLSTPSPNETSKSLWKEELPMDQSIALKQTEAMISNGDSPDIQLPCYDSQKQNHSLISKPEDKLNDLLPNTSVPNLTMNAVNHNLEKLQETNNSQNSESFHYNSTNSYILENTEKRDGSLTLEDVNSGVPSSRRHACKVCGKTYKQRCHLLSHMLSHSDHRPYVCDFCGKSFSLSWNLKTHLAVHNEEKPFVCSICGNRFKLKTALQRHQRSHMSRSFYLGSSHNQHHCQSMNSQSYSLCVNSAQKLHNQSQTESSKEYTCCSTSDTPSNPSLIPKHLETLTFTCDGCGKTHLISTIGNINHPHNVCDACGANFKLKDNAPQISCVSHTCNYCGKGFLETSALKCHIRTHTGERPYPCEQCGKHFVDSGALKRHVRIHTGEKPYVCVVCQKRFTTSTQLQIHTKMHN